MGVPSDARGAAAPPPPPRAAGPFCQQRFADAVAGWLQCRATPEERARYARYMSLLQDAAAAAEQRERAAGGSGGGSGGGGGSGASTGRSSRRAPRWDSLPDAAAPGALEAAACRARLASAPTAARRGGGAGRLGAPPPRPASAESPGWMHTATVARGGRAASAAPAGGGAAASAAAAAAGDNLRLPLDRLAVAPADAAAAAAAAAEAAASPPLTTSARISARAAAMAAAPPPPKLGAGAITNLTTSMASHGLKDLYPDLWANTLPICRPEAAPNKNFVSDWGEALRQGAGETWAPFLASTYTVANAQVHKPTDEFRVRQQTALASWVARQRTYTDGLLAPRAADAAAALLGALPPGERTELVELLRQLHAVARPESTKPVSHELHCRQHSVEDAEATALLKWQTRIKTMGFPRKVEVKGLRHAPASDPAAAAASAAPDAAAAPAAGEAATGAAAAAAAAAAARGRRTAAALRAARGGGGGGGGRPKAGDLIETLASHCPLKWACSELYPATSSYSASFGTHPGRMHRVVFPEVDCGWGHVDEVRHPPVSAAYPVPLHFTQRRREPGERPSEDDMRTTQRMAFKPRDGDSALRAVAAASRQIEASRAARNRSFIPLSKAGVQALPQWTTTHVAEFGDRPIDLTANRAMAAAVSAMFNGPTISFGRIAGARAQRGGGSKGGGGTAAVVGAVAAAGGAAGGVEVSA
ncbi:hypothetical protein Rsub_03133 [Raphidocelis subcapitata]|uniref:Uncharacterized protein n=1 Tax=Raphidocelis subcapitata TaxID=307507 RepID=A0A2V0NSE6_9CHLO|nr:hypothetical protein Rsub_03133 [Raphidocelis subcapitata]|eukprot:GBF90561.1 hypothetical protein Rsub_03133 [Raphidocelis subcapitata]